MFRKVFLSILAAVFHGMAYAIYLHQVFSGGSIPNPASWTIWAFLSTLNAVTFWKGSRDGLATAQFFTGSVACFAVSSGVNPLVFNWPRRYCASAKSA